MSRAIEVEDDDLGDLWTEDDDWARCELCNGMGRFPALEGGEVCPDCNGVGMAVDGFWSDSMAAAVDAGLGGAAPEAGGATYHRPWLYPKQSEAIFTPKRYSVIEASTKTGKTVGCMVWLLERSFARQGIRWWVAPVYTQAEMVFRRMMRALPKDIYKANETKLTLIFPNGSVIFFKSAEKPDNLYGEDVADVVIDEATRVREESWHAIRSTLTATRGHARLIGNVRGRKNWAYKMARKAQADDLAEYHYAKLTAWDAVEAGILVEDEIEGARAALPETVFRELYLAEASEDGSNPFDLQAIHDCIAPLAQGPASAWGWDLARGKRPGSDWTVGVGFNRERHTTAFFRFQAPWDQQVQRIKFATGRTPALVDATGVGDPIVEELQKTGRVEGFVFSPRSKQGLMEGLALAIQQRDIRYPDGPIVDELETMEYEYTRTGVRYSAPEGMHDDCVMALGLVVQQIGLRPPMMVRARVVGGGSAPTRIGPRMAARLAAEEAAAHPPQVQPPPKQPPSEKYWEEAAPPPQPKPQRPKKKKSYWATKK